MRSLFLFGLLTCMTGNPILALVLVALISLAGYGYVSARIFQVPRAINRWLAIRELERAVKINPHDANARADLGRLLLEAGRPASARPHLEAAHARAPEVTETAYYLGAARLQLGDEAGGRPLIEEALARDPRIAYGEPHLRLADFYLDRDRAAEALPHLEHFIAMHASSVEGQYKLARACVATGQTKRARAALDEAARPTAGRPASSAVRSDSGGSESRGCGGPFP